MWSTAECLWRSDQPNNQPGSALCVSTAKEIMTFGVGSLSICPLLFTRDLSGSVGLTCCAPSACRRGFACFLLLIHTAAVGAVEKWESRRLCGISKGRWETVGNLVLVFHGFHGPGFSTALRLLCCCPRAGLPSPL